MVQSLLFFLILQTPTPPRVSFCAVGDILLDRGTRSIIRQHGVDYPFENVAAFIRPFDLAYANLESPVSARGRSTGKIYCFRADTNFFAGVEHAGFDIIAIANNHTIDWGSTAFFDTKDIIERHGLVPVGACDSALEVQPVIVEKNGLRFAFIANVGIPLRGVVWPLLRTGPGQADIGTITAAIRKIRPKVDFVIVGLHWGVEYQYQPMPENVTWAHQLIDAGADLVVGSHPHILQPVEVYNQRLILYSLGNFVYDQHKIYQRQSGIFTCVFRKGEIDSAAFVPALLSDFHPDLARGRDFDSIAVKLTEISEKRRGRFRSAADRLFVADPAGNTTFFMPLGYGQIGDCQCIVQRTAVECGKKYGPADLGLRPGEVIKDCCFIPGEPGSMLAAIIGPDEPLRNRLALYRFDADCLIAEPAPNPNCRPWKIVGVDFDADSLPEIFVAAWQKEPFQPGFKNCLFVYQRRGDALYPKWPGAKLSLPFEDFLLADINDDGLKELLVLEKEPGGFQCVVAYQWCGNGFYGYKILTRNWSDPWLNETSLRRLINSF
jgi:poly-gamma-glutamate synthesis protein (capsule biosynthesis protein)